jgi:hypothetical protein
MFCTVFNVFVSILESGKFDVQHWCIWLSCTCGTMLVSHATEFTFFGSTMASFHDASSASSFHLWLGLAKAMLHYSASLSSTALPKLERW